MTSRGGWWNDTVFWKASSVALTHSDGSLSCARLASDQDCSASNVAIFDHLQNDSCSTTGGQLANHALRHLQVNRNMYPWSQIRHILMHICTSFWAVIQYICWIHHISAYYPILCPSNHYLTYTGIILVIVCTSIYLIRQLHTQEDLTLPVLAPKHHPNQGHECESVLLNTRNKWTCSC